MLGEKILIFDEIDSTNEYLKTNYEKLPNGTVIVAATQISGKGRYGKSWCSPRGGLWFSILFKPRKPLPNNFYTKLASVTMVETLKRYKINAGIKWPNDIYINNKKICGILTEGIYKDKLKAIIVGIGLNANNEIPENLKSTAISIKQLTKKHINITHFLKIFLRKFRTSYIKYKKVPHILTKIWKKYLLFKEGDKIIINNREISILEIRNDYMVIQDSSTIKNIKSIHELEET